MATKQSPQDKADQKRRDALTAIFTRINSGINFGKVKTWRDVYAFTSAPSDANNLDDAVTVDIVRPYFIKLKQSLEESIKNEKEKSTTTVNQPQTQIQKAPTQILKKPALASPNVPQEPLPVGAKPSSENDYLLPFCSKEARHLTKYWHQRKAAKELLDGILVHDLRGQALSAPPGYGKTFALGALICRLVESGWAFGKVKKDIKTFGPVRILYVTKNTVVEQTERVMRTMFGLTAKDGFEVLNYEQLRSKYGSLWVEEELRIENGEEVVIWKWRPFLNPVLIIWDESHSLKNPGSTQHQIACSVNDIETPVYQIHVSATLADKITSAKCFAISTHKLIENVTGISGSRLTTVTWPSYASILAGKDSSPDEYNEAAMGRLTRDLEPYIVRMKGVKPQFRGKNQVLMIDFETEQEAQFYADTEKRYFEEKEKLAARKAKGAHIPGGHILELVLLQKRCMAAELCRARHFAKKGYEAVQQGFAAAIAVKHKPTVAAITKIWVEEYGVPRDLISLVWGGGKQVLSKRERAAKEIATSGANAEMQKKLRESLDLEDIDMDEVMKKAEEELPEHLKLGAQDKEDRQENIDRFQSGKSLYCIYTFKAGGVGLSLHHTDELTKQKVAREKNGYARTGEFEPFVDKNGITRYPISQIPTRPRKCYMSVSYSGIDMIQSSGRCPRLNSLSDTEQYCLLYNNTVEVDVAYIYRSKLRCIHQVTKNPNEDWVSLLSEADRSRIVEEHTKNDKPDSEDDTGDLEIESENGD